MSGSQCLHRCVNLGDSCLTAVEHEAAARKHVHVDTSDIAVLGRNGSPRPQERDLPDTKPLDKLGHTLCTPPHTFAAKQAAL